MYIVAFNGPPQCGKDTAARMLQKRINAASGCAIIQHLSTPLRHIAANMVNWTLTDYNYESFKTTHFPGFNMTGRQLMISVSEDFLKPKFGKRIMADMLMASLSPDFDYNRNVIILADSGFQEETNAVCEHVGSANLYVINVHRDGCSFAGDAREWVSHPSGKRTMPLMNDGTLMDLRTEVGRIYSRMVNQLGWKL